MPLTLPRDAAAARLVTQLGRHPRALDGALAGQVARGRVVLITGAGGSIGGALARVLGQCGPARLVLLDQGEYALWRISQELTEAAPDLRQQMVIADIRDATRLCRVIAETRPDIVVHAAALKHVPIVQDHPLEGLLTNAIGSRNVIDAARAVGCRTLVLVSTDKAVAPASIMGASKRLAEMYGQATDIAAQTRGEGLRCVSLRLGNVMGSAGSVAQLFARQLAAGGPLTVTHPDMRRYFIAPEEAIGLLLATVQLAQADKMIADTLPATLPAGTVLVPRMAAPIRILDLAERMIRATGQKPGEDIAIRITGPRDGEKLSEQTCHGTEPRHPTPDPALLAVTPHVPDLGLLARALDELEATCRAGEDRLALMQVSRLIPGFHHNPSHNAPGDRADRLRA